MAGGGKGGGKKRWWSMITQIISILSGLGTLFNSVFGVLGKVSETFDKAVRWVKDTVTPIWNVVKPLYEWVEKNIWPTVKAVVNETNKIVASVNDIFKKINKLTDDLYNKTIGPLFTLWKNFEAFRDQALRLIAVVNKDLAQKIYRETEKVRAETLGRIEHVYAELRQTIDNWQKAINFRIKTITDIFVPWVTKIENTLTAFQKLAGTIIEKEYTLRSDTVQVTTTKYGMEAWKTFGKTSESPISESTLRIYNRTPTHTFTDQMIQVMDQGLKGDWADVEEYLDASISHIDRYEELEGFQLHEGLLTPAEISYLETLKEEPKEVQ